MQSYMEFIEEVAEFRDIQAAIIVELLPFFLQTFMFMLIFSLSFWLLGKSQNNFEVADPGEEEKMKTLMASDIPKA